MNEKKSMEKRSGVHCNTDRQEIFDILCLHFQGAVFVLIRG